MMHKLDMSEAYDRVERVFLQQVLVAMSFPDPWITLIMKCVNYISFSVLVDALSFWSNLQIRLEALVESQHVTLYDLHCHFVIFLVYAFKHLLGYTNCSLCSCPKPKRWILYHRIQEVIKLVRH